MLKYMLIKKFVLLLIMIGVILIDRKWACANDLDGHVGRCEFDNKTCKDSKMENL